MTKREFAIHRDEYTDIRDYKIVRVPRERLVRVLARAEGWAMVRPKGFATYCVPEKELSPVEETEREGKQHDQ